MLDRQPEPPLVLGGQSRDAESLVSSSDALTLCLFLGGIVLALVEACR